MIHSEKVQKRFWNKVIFIPFHSCYEWGASRQPQGYGWFRLRDKMKTAHRISWEIHFGEIPKGLGVLHKCDNPGCVRPEHLFLGTQRDNAIDMIKKCRGTAKFTEENIKEIRALYATGKTQKELAKMFNSQQSHISEITRRKQWKHI
jgi:hypothetical protein